ncbi:plasmid recombination protein [Pseudarthrobacter sp. NPDC092439]|uniref:plasmid recombination protein n=1 Tax=unclassified Pseudarthrobacter TaxID=2647000 RepID=UPI003811A4B6
MSWTVTYDASPEAKVKAAGSHAVARDRHLGRGPDLAAGFTFGHRNPNIDLARSKMNITFVNDGEGGFRAPVVTKDPMGRDRPPSAEFADYRDSLLAQVKKPLRKDAVILRGVMLQLDPRWFDAHCPDWRTEGLTDEAQQFIYAQLKWACGEFGQQNIVCGSIDLDETSPHLQLSVVPVTDDGRLSQKDFFRGPGHFRKQRKELCDALERAGYDPQRTVTERSTERTSSEVYARTADMARATLAVAKRDTEKLWKERQQVRAEKARQEEAAKSIQSDREEVDAQLEELPRLRRRAREEAVVEARADARREVADEHQAAQERERRAQAAERVHMAAGRDLLALREQIQQQLDDNPSPPEVPSYDDMRRDIVEAQPHLLRAFLKSIKFKDGSTLEDKFEDFQRRSFAAHQRRESDAFGRYSGPGYEQWKERSLQMQRKIDAATFSTQVADLKRPDEVKELRAR